ncbi:MFS transporter [Nocardioides sp. GY 10127]|uniref:MFS transporter n=1 Tax=Nocardioides sp. GY 10127 TaxID=2569762 RepID=UPI0010A8BEA7|nr:MFS transporter [Nocardioides sp. GY 10127]TIC84009.1 MFS transporter [Nocardioides sp. GY 10127]
MSTSDTSKGTGTGTGTTTDAGTDAGAGAPPGVLVVAVAAVLFLSYLLFAVAWNWGDLYIRSLGFSASRTALMTNAVTLAQVTGSLVAADVLLRLGARRAFALGSMLIVLGGAAVLTHVFPVIFLIRFAMGVGGSIVVVLMSGIVARLMSGRALQVANGVNSVAFNTGLAVALTFGSRMAGTPTRAVLLAAGLSVLVLLAWLVLSPRVLPPEEAAAAREDDYSMADGFREWFNWVFSLAYTGLLSYYIVAFTFMDPDTIRWVVYAGVVGALSGTVVSARVSDRTKPLVVVVCGAAQLVAAAAVLGFAEHRYAPFVGVLLGLVIFFPMPFFVQLAFLRPGVTPRHIAVTFSIFWAVSYAGSVVFIQVFAWITDATGGLSGGVPVSHVPLVFIVLVESTFVIGAALLLRWFRAQPPAATPDHTPDHTPAPEVA